MFESPHDRENSDSSYDRAYARQPCPGHLLPDSDHARAVIPEEVIVAEELRQRLEDEITTLAGHLNAANHRLIKLLDEFDRHKGWCGVGIRSLAHWLSFKCGIGRLAAREKVRVALALRNLPKIDAAFERGEISYSKVRAMTRAATPENEAFLLQIARHGTADHMERLVRAYRRHGPAAEVLEEETRRPRAARFWCYAEDDETMVFGGRLPVEQGRLLEKALDALVAEYERDGRSGGDGESGAEDIEAQGGMSTTESSRLNGVSRTSAALQTVSAAPDRCPIEGSETKSAGVAEGVSAETLQRATSGVSDDTPPDGSNGVSADAAWTAVSDVDAVESALAEHGEDQVPDAQAETAKGTKGVSAETPPEAANPPLAVSRATALAHLAEHYLATGGARARSLAGHEACQIFVHVNANDAHPDNRINGGHTAYAEDRRRIAPHVVRQLACDAALTTVLENDKGEVLNVGRRTRTVPRRIAHALRIRDGGCRFPACGRRRWTDAHHIRHWAHGGETSLDNLVTLCRHHHRCLHRGEFRIGRDSGGELRFVDRSGEPIEPVTHPQFTGFGGAEAATGQLEQENRRRGVAIDRRTAVTRWTGERMDYSLCVGELMRADGVGYC